MDAKTFSEAFSLLHAHVQDLPTPVVELIEVQTKDPFKVLVTTILSARSKDQTTAQVAKKLFTKVKQPQDLRKLTLKQLERLIYPIGFYRNKAKFLRALPDALDVEFGGRIPNEVDALTRLPGVGRKTANLVVAVAFKKPALCVDVHVHRIMNRLGYVKTATPFETEMALRASLPKKFWLDVNWVLVSFGQHHCGPVSPRCSTCVVRELCERRGVTRSR